MSGLSIGIGVLLAALGLVGYMMSGGASLTALIPTAFGLAFLLLGILARNESKRKHVMHAAAALSLLGAGFTVGGLVKAFSMLGGATVERPQAVIAQAIMAVLCLVFLVFAVRSFIRARRARQQ